MRVLIGALLGSVAVAALAHETGDATPGAWRVAPWSAAALLAAALGYALGLARLWRQSGARGIAARHAAAFAAGWVVTLAALAPPIDSLAQVLFSMHMVQHELLMVVAAPLLVLGRPFVAWSWAWPRAAQVVHRAFALRWLALAWNRATAPLGAWLLHAVTLWAWHAPRLFEAALAHQGLHELQHVTFMLSALLFWWSILGRRRYAVALLSLFTTMLHTGVLGALLALSSRVWYPAYGPAALAFGVDPLADQQLGGLLMWVPAGAAYLIAALTVGAQLLAAPAPVTQAAPAVRSSGRPAGRDERLPLRPGRTS